jgi:arabinose-5-phosphate isomerase
MNNMLSDNKDIISAKTTIDKEISAINELKDSLGNNFIEALDLMENAKGRVIVTGMGKSGHVGKKIAATLASTGTPSFFVHPGEASHGDLGMFTENDVVLAISNSGESKELSDVLLYCKRYGIPLISMTNNPESTLGRTGDVLLKLPSNGEACPLGLAPTSSTTATLVYGDVLAVALIERKGFTKNDYKKRHPGGKLGAILRKVGDLMHTGLEIPFAKADTLMKDVIITMTQKNLGCVGIIDETGSLIGIITDGDLKRHLSSDLINKPASEIMTTNPKTTNPDILAAEALAYMNDKKITCLFVMKDNVPVGIIHMHDFLRAGVA